LSYRLAWYCSLFICFLALYCTSTCIRIFGLLLPASQGGPSPVQFTAAGTNTLAAPAIAGLSAGPLRTAGPSWLMFASMPASHTCARPKNQTDAYAQHIAILGTKKKQSRRDRQHEIIGLTQRRPAARRADSPHKHRYLRHMRYVPGYNTSFLKKCEKTIVVNSYLLLGAIPHYSLVR
jgi:hypothetical protein